MTDHSLSFLLSERLFQRRDSVASTLETTSADVDEPALIFANATSKSVPLRDKQKISSAQGIRFQGLGVGTTANEAIVPALAELIERSALSTFYDGQFIWASADSLSFRCLDLSAIPHCSDQERKSSYCSLNLPTKSEPIRWVMGVSLNDGQPILVPAVMSFLHAGWREPQERFWLPISTGCAAHKSYLDALLSAACEVVERDAISIVWLQQLALTRIVVDELGPATEPYWTLYNRGSADVQYHFFDATTDIGLPTVYGVQVSRHHPYARTIVACATALNFDTAIAKVMKDFAIFKRAFLGPRQLPANPEAFTNMLDGASYMGRPEHAHAFDFLLHSRSKVSLKKLSSQSVPIKTLPQLVAHLSRLNMTVIATDLSTDEAIRAGLRVVRVIIPQLQPLSLHPAVQYRANRRLYQLPVTMGLESKSESELNKWPQPFA